MCDSKKYDPLSMDNYKLLSDWAQYTNARYDTHLKALLTIHGVLLAGLSFVVKTVFSNSAGANVCFMSVSGVILSIVGIIICLAGYQALKRILVTCNLRYFQLREFEKAVNDTRDEEKLKTFTYGYQFIKGELKKTLTVAEYEELINKRKGKDNSCELGFSQRRFASWINWTVAVVYAICLLTIIFKLFGLQCFIKFFWGHLYCCG